MSHCGSILHALATDYDISVLGLIFPGEHTLTTYFEAPYCREPGRDIQVDPVLNVHPFVDLSDLVNVERAFTIDLSDRADKKVHADGGKVLIDHIQLQLYIFLCDWIEIVRKDVYGHTNGVYKPS